MFSKDRLTYIIGLMLMVSSLLMVVADNVPYIGSFRWLWGPVSLLFVLLVNPQVYWQQSSRNVLFFGLLFCGILQYTLWAYMNEWYMNGILDDFYAMLVVVVFYVHLYSNRFYDIWVKIALWGLRFILITGIMTIIATVIDPYVIRASYSYGEAQVANLSMIKRLGFGSYGYMSAIIAIFPFFIYKIKINVLKPFQRYKYLLMIVFSFFVLVRSQIFANILMALVISVLSITGSQNAKKTLFTMALLALLIAIPGKQFYAKQLVELSFYVELDSELHLKLNDMAEFLINPVVDSSSTGMGVRAQRYPWLWAAFSERPLLGDASGPSWNLDFVAQGGHLHWMSRLAIWGILGFLLYLKLLKNIFTPLIRAFNKPIRFYYMLSFLSIIFMGLVKAIGGREQYIVLIIILPGLYMADIIKNTSNH